MEKASEMTQVHSYLSHNKPYGSLSQASRSDISFADLESNASSSSSSSSTRRNYKTLLTQHLLTVPFILACTVIFASFLQLESSTRGVVCTYLLVVGLFGWALAFLMRRPTYFLLDRVFALPHEFSAIVTLVLAGVVEEVCRLACVRLFVSPASNSGVLLQAYFLGLGWSLSESVYFIVQNLLLIRPYRTAVFLDVRSVESRKQLAEILGSDLSEITPWWGVFWRFSSVMMHIGLSLCVAYKCVLVWPAALVHAVLYVVWGEYLSVFGIPATSYVTLLVSMTIFLIGLALFGEIV
ncbi:hypothetical protein BC938DRAFT_472348 [Jimgerdemannia flammicorona]|uniref:Transmembrane protein 147 n=1 Tax=Jimgerdemannia flammicorona TaxID=994334 RepID=A0A433Q6C0_9FUNG|nr:hypothetical protein BC938DRAFT_472348 [Jimgerdemannia flammicorona]